MKVILSDNVATSTSWRKEENSEKSFGVFTLPAHSNTWKNQELLKDCGLIPYMFHKIYGYKSTMLGCRAGEYSYLDMLPGLRMEFLSDCSDKYEYLGVCVEYLREHYHEMDVLLLYGVHYPFYRVFLEEYRRLRLDGKVYIALDANSSWIDRIEWANPNFSAMLDDCDVITTGSRELWRFLNKKWNRWTIDYIPNGFYNSIGSDINISYEQKENVLLTVGRIGSTQKSNNILLEAFASVHDKLPDWRVHLVGIIDESFKSYIDEYFVKYPTLRDKVIFKGQIDEKEELYSEYARAKVFVLSSVVEGGTPNVVAESLFHGCYQITSEVDAHDDITNCGDIGRVFSPLIAEALADTLLEVCSNEELIRDAFPRILTYAQNNFDWEVIIKRIHHILFGK